MNKSEWISAKISKLVGEGRTQQQAIAMAYSMWEQGGTKQEGGVQNYNKSGDLSIGERDVATINKNTGIQFTPEFAKAYFSTQSAVTQPVQPQKDYSTYPIVDITSDGQFTDRKIWRTQRPEWFVGKQEAVEGKDYTRVPYKQWESYQQSPEHLSYMAQKFPKNSQIAEMKYGGHHKLPTAQQGIPPNFNYLQGDYNLSGDVSTADNKDKFGNSTGANIAKDFEYIQGDANLSGIIDGADKVDKLGNPLVSNEEESSNQDWIKYNILNPYSQGMDLGTSLAYTGQQFGKGNTGMGIAGAGLSALKGVRSFMSGYGSGKGERNVQDQMREDLYNRDEKLYQFGGITFDEEMLNNTQPNIDLATQAQSPEWISKMDGRAENQVPQEVPAAIAAAQVELGEEKNKNFDSASARDIWTQKTGLPWSEAKRLGYTDGTAKDNIKLLGELNDKRFNKDNLRSKPFTAPKQAVKTQAAEIAKITKVQDYFNSAEFKALPKSKKVKAQAKAIEESGITDIIGKIGEVLGNPLQSFGEYAKYGKLPSSGFSKNNTNALDDVLGLINPANWANHAGNAVDYADQGDYENAGKEALGALPAAGKFLKTVKYVPYLPGLPAAGGATSRAAGYLGQGAARLQPGAQKVFPIYNGARRGAEYVSGSYRPYEEGGFTQGEEYDLTEEEVQDLISKGYKIKYKE